MRVVRFLSPVLALAIALGAAGCVGDEGSSAGPVKNQDQWAMPLDEFYVYSPDLDNYAEELLISNCLEEQGYQWPVPWQDTDFPQAADVNAVGFRLFTVPLAQEWGYESPPPPDEESRRLWREFGATVDSYFPNPELDAALLACTDEVRDKDGNSLANFDGVNFLAGLALQAEEVVLQDQAVVDATARWRRCLEPQVDFTLPDDPRTGMPPVEAMRDWGATNGRASADEIAAAVADAECRESSGLTAAAYERNWEEQQKLVEKNRDKLERIRAAAVERKKMLLTIVAENAPPAPPQ